MTNADPRGIYVLAGPNGAGKSSVGGRILEASGGTYFNPDQAARRLIEANPQLTEADANGEAWSEMVRLLRQAIAKDQVFAFETTLGGATIFRLLHDAAKAGTEVRVWFVALASADVHIERVSARVAEGGHDIPVELIRARYDSSRLHLIELLPVLKEVWVYDNTASNEAVGSVPQPTLIMHMRNSKIVDSCALNSVPQWAKGIVLAGVKADASEQPAP